MYTQCPECESAFRVTAEVLKQAAGMVRCGNCSHAFNSLEYLSEEKPKPKLPDPVIPELKPEPGEDTSPELPKSISAEQSAALLKTLDQLAGDDIVIEDTGVEWRVMDDDDDDDSGEELDDFFTKPDDEADDQSEPEESAAEGDPGLSVEAEEQAVPEQTAYVEALSELELAALQSPAEETRDDETTEADQADESSGVWIMQDSDANETADIFDGGTATIVEEEAIFDGSQTIVDELLDEAPTPVDEFLSDEPGEIEAGDVFEAAAGEMRFDDNTPLPDDFLLDDDDDESSAVEQTPDVEEEPAEDPEALQADLQLGNPDEWQQLLEDFDDLLADVPASAGDEEGAAESEPTSDDETDERGESPVDDVSVDDADTSIDDELETAAFEDDENHEADEKHTDTSIDDDLMSAAFEIEESEERDDTESGEDEEDTVESDDEDGEEDIAESDDEEAEDVAAEPEDEETEEDAAEPEDDDVDDAAELEEYEDAADSDEETDDDADEDDEVQDSDDTDVEGDVEDESEDDHESDDEAEEDSESEDIAASAEEPQDDDPLDLSEILDPDDEGLVDEGESDPNRDDSDLPELNELVDRPEDDEHYVPPQTEEEQTINMMIDQDLLAIATEDEDGFTSTIVYEEQQSKGVQSIIMEGESIREAFDEIAAQEAEAAQRAATEEADAARLEMVTEESEIHAVVGDDAPSATSRLAKIGLAAVVVLGLLGLGTQYVHQNRADLATDPQINNMIAPIYRAIGQPFTPNWNISGWRIEQTRGATDDNDQLLTIYAVVSNQSDTPLPYPVITVQLTDLYQETLGSLVLSPAEYLPDDNDTRTVIDTKDSFEAIIPIDDPSPDAAGYLLNTCYRQVNGDLLCAVDDFK